MVLYRIYIAWLVTCLVNCPGAADGEADDVEDTLAAVMEFQEQPWPESRQSENAELVEEVAQAPFLATF